MISPSSALLKEVGEYTRYGKLFNCDGYVRYPSVVVREEAKVVETTLKPKPTPPSNPKPPQAPPTSTAPSSSGGVSIFWSLLILAIPFLRRVRV